MTAPDLLSRIDAAIGLRPELADLLGECRAEIVRLSEAAAAPVVDNETAELLERLRGDDGEILRAIGGALNSVYMERSRGGKVSDQGEEVRVHRAVLEAIRPAADRLEALAAAAPVVDGGDWWCQADAGGLPFGQCSPENPIHRNPCGWRTPPAAPVVDVTALAEGVIAASSALPEWRPVEFALDPGEPGDDESLIWGVTASWRGPGDAWALTRGCYMHGGQTCFNRDGGIAWEERGADAEWRAQHRFTLEEALELGKKFLPKIVVNGETWAQVVAWRTGGRQRDENGRPIIPSDGA